MASPALAAQEHEKKEKQEKEQTKKEKTEEEPEEEPDELEEMEDDFLDEMLEGDDESVGTTEKQASVVTAAKGFLELRPRVYFNDRNQGKNDEQLIFESELEIDFEFREGFTGYFRPRVYVDALDGDLKRFEPFEGYFTWTREDWDLRVGQFVENWGIVDTYNPIDVLNRRDFATDFLDADRLGELGARYQAFLPEGDTLGEPTVALYFIPVWRETLFAPEDQRFSFSAPGVTFEEDNGFEPSGSERLFGAGRFQSTLTTTPANADLQFVVSYGPERTPLVVPVGTVRVPAYYGAWTFGAGLRAVPNQDAAGDFLSTLTFKTELVYKRPYTFEDSPIAEPDDYFAYVFGIDRPFYNVFKDQDTLTLTVEYAGEQGADDIATLFRPFRNDIILRGFWEANDFARTSLELRGIWDFDTSEYIIEGIFERQLRAIDDDLKLIAQVQVFEPPGTGESLFDFFPNNSSAALGLRWDF